MVQVSKTLIIYCLKILHPTKFQIVWHTYIQHEQLNTIVLLFIIYFSWQIRHFQIHKALAIDHNANIKIMFVVYNACWIMFVSVTVLLLSYLPTLIGKMK